MIRRTALLASVSWHPLFTALREMDKREAERRAEADGGSVTVYGHQP